MGDRFRFDGLWWLGLWLVIAAAVLFLRMLPLNLGASGWPRPDALLILTLAWVLRRPAHLPAPAIGLVYLVEDLLSLRPPGLWALAVLLGTEFLRRRQAVAREIGLMLEWGLVAGVLVAMTLGYRLVLAIVMIPQDPLDLSLMKLLGTVVLYPVAVFVLQYLLRVHKPATGEMDERGRKL